jgi:hypothetical protein
LRREEVAQPAAISVEYYTRLEQGRVQVSASLLAILSRALRLAQDLEIYLYEVAGKAVAWPRRRRITQELRPAMRRLLDQLAETPRPSCSANGWTCWPGTGRRARCSPTSRPCPRPGATT